MSDSFRRLFRAPGRVNLIGEHTDYNDGFVMPVAINFSTWITLSPVAERHIEFYSDKFNEKVILELDNPPASPRGHWSDYPIGVAVTLLRHGYDLQGARLLITSEVPLGSGLSSSAALEVVTALSLAKHSNLNIQPVELAKLCREAENEFVGARVGIMDQFASVCGGADRALLIDCRSLEFKLLPLSNKAQLVICNTMVKHELASSAYNERRSQCEEGVKWFSSIIPGVTALRDLNTDQLEEHGKGLQPIIYRRCRHVVSENERVILAAEALNHDDLSEFGELMYKSHESLRDDYEVSCRELDLMVELASGVKGVYGARMTGGGFGGCTVNLVERDQVGQFRIAVVEGYEKALGIIPEVYVCSAVNGAEEVIEN